MVSGIVGAVKAATYSLSNSVQELTSVVRELKDELSNSTKRCDDLEQYTRRNSIIVSGVPVNTSSSTE